MTSIETEIKDIVNHIKGKYKYTNFIKQIVFNNYANIKPNEKINFSFPLTVLIGMNGCNKTRVLQALYGIPAGNSVGDFWFSTPLDPINYKKKPRYTYFYSDNKNSEILYPVVYNKASGKSKGDDPDYWETTKLTGDLAKKYPKDRYSPIEKECLYIDSKIELSAYDICFNFNGRDTGKKTNYKENKKFIRSKSTYLKKNIDNNSITFASHKKPQNDPPININEDSLKWIADILGKSYSSAIEIYHKHYKYWGDSLFFNSEYSEARAGSGELKVINMVTQIKKAPDQSLILIDEPEISLHPGAQLQLLKFLLTEIRDKNHQIVFTTHSPTMIKYLPSECIRLFKKDPSFDKFYIEENVDPTLAFENIGEPITNKMNIIVEDKMAKKILDAIIKSDKSLSKSAFNVMHIPGGAKDLICSTIPQHMYSKNIYFILDGDQNFNSNNYKSYLDIPLRKTNNPNQYLLELQHKIYSLTQVKHSSIKFTKNSNETCDDTIKRYETFLSFYENNVKFFPQQIPEDILWNAKDLNDLLFQNLHVRTKIEELDNNPDLTSKNKIYELASIMFTNDMNLTNRCFDLLIDMLLNHFVNNPQNSDYNNITTILKNIQRDLT